MRNGTYRHFLQYLSFLGINNNEKIFYKSKGTIKNPSWVCKGSSEKTANSLKYKELF